MNFVKFLAGQFRKPSGFFGRHVMVPLLNRLNESMNNLVLEVLDLESRDRVLEVGFGGGELIAKMSRIVGNGHITGVDFSEDAVEACTKRFDSLIRAGFIDLHCGDVAKLPFDPGTFTKVCTVNTIYFWPAPSEALHQIHRVLKPEGTLVVCFNPRTVMEHQGKIIHHGFTLYHPEEVAALLTESGFRQVQLYYGKNRFGDCAAARGIK